MVFSALNWWSFLPFKKPKSSQGQETPCGKFIVKMDGKLVKPSQKSGVERPVHELFAGGIPEQKFAMWIVLVKPCFPKEKHQNSQKRAKFIWTFHFDPFFGLVCRGDSWKNPLVLIWTLRMVRRRKNGGLRLRHGRTFWFPALRTPFAEVLSCRANVPRCIQGSLSRDSHWEN